MAEVASAHVTLIPQMTGIKDAVTGALDSASPTLDKGGKSWGATLMGGLGKVAKTGAKVVGGGIAATAGVAIAKGFSRLNQIEQAQAKLSGLGHSGEAVEAIMDSALQAVRGTAYGMGDAASVAATMVAAGIEPGKDLTRSLSLVGDAAQIAGTDLGSMGSIISKVATADMMQMDVANQMMDAGIPILQLVGDQMGVTAQEARKLASEGKISFDIFQKAIEDGMGGAALKSGETFSGAMANVGAALGRVGANFLSGVFPLMKDGLGTLQDLLAPIEEQASKVGAAFGEWAGTAMSGVTQFFAGFAAAPEARGNLDGLAAIGAKVREEIGELATRVGGFATALGGLLQRLAPLGEAIGKLALGAFVVAWEGLKVTIDAVTAAITWATANWTAIEATVVSLGAAIGVLGAAFGGVHLWLAAFKAGGFVNLLLGAVKATQLWATVTKGIALAQAALNAVMLMNPIVLVVAGIAALTAGFIYLWNNVEGFRNFWIGVWDAIKAAASAVADWFTGTVVPAFQSAWEGVKGAWSAAGEWFAGIWDGIVTGAQNLANWLTGVWATITASASAAWEAFRTALSSAWAAIEPIVTVPVRFWATVFSTVWETIKTVVATAIVVVHGLLTGNMEQVSAAISAGWTKITGLFSEAWAKITGIIGGAWTRIRELFNAGISAISGAVSNAVNAIANWFRDMGSRIHSAVTTAWNNVRTAFANGINVAVSFAQALPGRVASAISALATRLVSIATSAWNGLRSAFSTGITNAITVVRQLPGRVKGALTGAATWLTSIGRNVIQGFINGTKAMANRIKDAVLGPIKNAVNSAKKFLGIASPSKLLRSFGQYTGEGFELGLDDMGRSISAAGERMAQAAVPDRAPVIPARVQPHSPGGASALLAGNAGGFTVQGPLVNVANLSVRDDRDIKEISRQLQASIDSRLRAQGQPMTIGA